MRNIITIAGVLFLCVSGFSQENIQDGASGYKKRVLESTEIDFLAGYYTQDGDNAAVTGGRGTEKLTDINPTIVIAVPLNDDDVLKIDAGVSAYSSASSSNINPFDGKGKADPFVASSGASSKDVWANFTGSYSHHSDDRNKIWSGKFSVSNEFDYSSIGVGGSYTKLFNDKNTEFSLDGNVYFDSWKPLYPKELQSFDDGGSGLNSSLFNQYNIIGNTNYDPLFTPFNSKTRNSYSIGLGFSQILSKRMQISLALDIVRQSGLLSTPFQRVYFADIDNSYIENFHLADAVEQLPDNRLKFAFGGRLNYYVNEWLVVRTFYRYYTDDWGIASNTASITLPVKINDRFTLSPSYRFYNQSEADYFAPYEQHQSSENHYTSDYDLSMFTAHQYGMQLSYNDIFTKFHIMRLKLKNVDLKINQYQRDSGFKALLIAGGFKFVL